MKPGSRPGSGTLTTSSSRCGRRVSPPPQRAAVPLPPIAHRQSTAGAHPRLPRPTAVVHAAGRCPRIALALSSAATAAVTVRRAAARASLPPQATGSGSILRRAPPVYPNPGRQGASSRLQVPADPPLHCHPTALEETGADTRRRRRRLSPQATLNTSLGPQARADELSMELSRHLDHAGVSSSSMVSRRASRSRSRTPGVDTPMTAARTAAEPKAIVPQGLVRPTAPPGPAAHRCARGESQPQDCRCFGHRPLGGHAGRAAVEDCFLVTCPPCWRQQSVNTMCHRAARLSCLSPPQHYKVQAHAAPQPPYLDHQQPLLGPARCFFPLPFLSLFPSLCAAFLCPLSALSLPLPRSSLLSV